MADRPREQCRPCNTPCVSLPTPFSRKSSEHLPDVYNHLHPSQAEERETEHAQESFLKTTKKKDRGESSIEDAAVGQLLQRMHMVAAHDNEE